MAQKVNPNGFRIPYIKNWSSRWNCKSSDYHLYINEDIKIRKFIEKNINRSVLSHVDIERKFKSNTSEIRLNIFTSAVGLVIGQKNKNLQFLTKELLRLLKPKKYNLFIKVYEVKNVDKNAQLLANQIALRIENRTPFRVVLRMFIKRGMKANLKGMKVIVSGRLNGVEMARSESASFGTIPLSTLKYNIDYATSTARTTYGAIGVKVWVSHGEYVFKKLKTEFKKEAIENNK